MAERRTWLFQSGLCGEGTREEQIPAPKAIARLDQTTAGRQ
jgi:hypothetical protein